MRRLHGKTLLLGLAGLMSFAVAAAGQSTTREAKQPNGTIQAATKSVAVGAGVIWGDGTLTFEGKDHLFSIKNLSLTDLGIGEATVKGNVYNLGKLEDFTGTYRVTEPDFALGGAGPPWSRSYRGMILGNDKGVVVQIWIVREGPHLHLIDNAVEVRLK
ncbi:MAG TPA: hypothetical protein VMW17_17635 [Candidatus Binatia bacterium]|nr:hypothetical protein [Candidatus Binatia bacterium]